METTIADKIANTVLYEGYMLYPYRATSVKNRQRFNWGTLAPKTYSDSQNGTESWEMQVECLVAGDSNAELSISVRFLHLVNREIGHIKSPADEITVGYETVSSLEVEDKLYHSWQEATERSVELDMRVQDGIRTVESFKFAASEDIEPIKSDQAKIVGVIVRSSHEISSEIDARITKVKEGLSKLTLFIRNTTRFDAADANRDEALLHSLVSTHAVTQVRGGEFVSLLEPPDEFAQEAARCENRGAFPILAGEKGSRDCMLASPIILYDYPEIAPESPGELFDGTEIDEILTLRILTMTDEEKREMRSVDERARKILERSEAMSGDDLLRMHGTIRGLERSNSATHG
jgi:hydrogenase maturation protease